MKQKFTSVFLAILLTLSATTLLADEPQSTVQDSSHTQEANSGHHEVEGEDLPYWSVIPFALILLSIALLPIVSHTTSHWWESNTNKLILSLVLGAVSFVILVLHGWFGKIVHTLVFEYVPFIILLGSLFYISGGIRLKGDIEATPLNNTIFLIIGTFLASFIGTTGASMLLIRPILKTNSERKHVVHTVVFFIFLVSNIGGSLTPLGDPPLFLGYLIGVPFTWTFKLLPELLVAGILLLILYFIWDSIAYKKETAKDLKKDHTHKEKSV